MKKTTTTRTPPAGLIGGSANDTLLFLFLFFLFKGLCNPSQVLRPRASDKDTIIWSSQRGGIQKTVSMWFWFLHLLGIELMFYPLKPVLSRIQQRDETVDHSLVGCFHTHNNQITSYVQYNPEGSFVFFSHLCNVDFFFTTYRNLIGAQ